MTHYMMDCFYQDANAIDGYRADSFAVKASSDQGAIVEAQRIAIGRAPCFFKVRIVTSSTARSGGTCIHDSRKDG